MFDKDRIKEDANCIVVAEALGIPVTRKGNRYLILCPDHGDRRLGSCYLSEKGYYCYSCGAKGDVFHLVMKTQGVDFHESMEIVADICGDKEYYMTTAEKPKARILPYQYQKAIGLVDNPVYVDYFFVSKSDCDDFMEDHPGSIAKTIFDESDTDYYADTPDNVLDDPKEPIPPEKVFGYAVSVMKTASPLTELYLGSRSEYYRIVREHCLDAMESAKNIYEAVIAESKNPINIIKMYKEKMRELSFIAETYGTDPATENAPLITVETDDVAVLGHALNKSILSKVPF